jgi:signal transduction histidine kinase
VRGVFIEGSDVTAIFRAERELRTERAMFTSAFEVLPVPALLVAGEGLLRENSAARRFRQRCGLSSWSGLPLYAVPAGAAVPDDERPASRALQGETFHAREYELGLGDAARVPVYVSAGPVRVDGEVVAAMVAVQDISVLKAADRIKDEFLATVSHDLRSPLSAIQGWAQHLRRPRDPQSTSRAVEAILRAAATQRRLIDDLLDASALAAGVLRVALGEQDLVPLVEDVVAGSEAVAAERGIVLEARLPLAPLLARADAVRVRQVVSNLVDNALKATPEGGRVEVRLWREGEEAVLEVRDSGQGISAARLGHLFDRFYRVPGAEAAPGLGRHLGLGLTIVRALVELHGGSVSAASEGEGRGATFTVRLPALP